MISLCEILNNDVIINNKNSKEVFDLSKQKVEHLLELREPDYMEDFECTGSLCTDTCCKGWDIVIDEATCGRYAKTQDTEVRELLSRAIVHREEEQSDGSYEQIACIRMGRGQRCLFLRNDGLCLIQRKTEEKNLSETCRTYPRVIYVWNEHYAERALCVSCPEAARLILARSEPLHFVTRQLPEAELAGLRIKDAGERLRPDCLPLRRFLVQILQTQSLPLVKRLRLADRFFWRWSSLSGHQAEKKRLELRAKYMQAIAAGSIDEASGNCAFAQSCLEVLRPMLFLRLQNPELRPAFRQRLEWAAAHWELQAEAAVTAHSQALYQADEEIYRAFFLPTYQLLLENYLVNGVFKNLFILEEQKVYGTEWFRLILQFVIVRLLLIAQLQSLQKLPDQAQVIALIQQVARAIGHDTLYLNQAAAKLQAQGGEEALADFCYRVLL